jgi:hypothetical protein
MVGLLGATHASEDAEQCTSITRVGYVIERPGAYCLDENMNLRLDFADHPAQHAIVEIRASNVTLDMRGREASSGRWLGLFPQRISNGIKIEEYDEGGKITRPSNIIIKNGRLSNFANGVYYYHDGLTKRGTTRNVPKIGRDEYLYAPSNIHIINVMIDNCDNPFDFLDVDDTN